MGTTEPDDTTRVQGYISTAQGGIEVVQDLAYGSKTRGALYPLVLIILAVLAIVLGHAFVALLPLVLLAVWIGGSGR